MVFGYFLKTFRTFKRRGGAREKEKKIQYIRSRPIKLKEEGPQKGEKKKMSTYPITTNKAECLCSLSRKFFSLLGT